MFLLRLSIDLSCLTLCFMTELVYGHFQIRSLYSSKVEELKQVNSRLFDEVATAEFKYESVMTNLLNNQESSMLYLDKINQILEKVNQIREHLNIAGEFLREHKFHERDWRDLADNFMASETASSLSYYKSMMLKEAYDAEAKFMISFPVKQLLDEDEDVVRNCMLSASNCIEYVANFAM